MFLDFLFELFGDFSPVYLYISVILSALYVIRWLPEFDFSLNKSLHVKDTYHLKARFLPLEKNINEIIEKRNWLAITTKRIELPDDDEEEAHFSFYKSMKKRGGALCKNLYSLILRNLAYSGEYY
ncbi:hypothetical protein [Ornithinibacillus sp. 179-J 7C1 HS]|uniref:hypothetical protein n=1 Tax=Ornithinibacillus sp. 179-J 7C1 HS TaxID=3142384 RepID=UPI0039A2CFC1